VQGSTLDAQNTALLIGGAGPAELTVVDSSLSAGTSIVLMDSSADDITLTLSLTTLQGSDLAHSGTFGVQIVAGGARQTISMSEVTIDVPGLAFHAEPSATDLVVWGNQVTYSPTAPVMSSAAAAIHLETATGSRHHLTLVNSVIDCGQSVGCLSLSAASGTIGANLADNQIGQSVTLTGNIMLASDSRAGTVATGTDEGELAARENTAIGGDPLTVDASSANVLFVTPSFIDTP